MASSGRWRNVLRLVSPIPVILPSQSPILLAAGVPAALADKLNSAQRVIIDETLADILVKLVVRAA
jgi:hypothetical protein